MLLGGGGLTSKVATGVTWWRRVLLGGGGLTSKVATGVTWWWRLSLDMLRWL